ncbi:MULTISPECIES: hypothetical protein [Niallia]|jgi:hypothetical protein|uniref:hypothetical protein n=1 Tax=Niallia TaxID=2837506 RepID=UPI0013D3670E|nr:hypothetical protein [Niallia circulans]QJX62895.1 hypothetical protein HLK66_15380 [Niallia circulans]
MSRIDEIEDAEILYYVYNLNWLLPKENQEIAIDFLINLPPDKADMIIPKYGKECWENSVRVIKKIGYPNNKKALPKLARLLQDRNWPGSLEAIELFRELGKAIATPYIEQECISACKQKDLDWLENLFFACNSLNYSENDFKHKDSYRSMKKSAESL